MIEAPMSLLLMILAPDMEPILGLGLIIYIMQLEITLVEITNLYLKTERL
jgi:hypothetical protein